MGVWDHTTFGNDDACDWAGELQSYQDLSFVSETLDKVIDIGGEYLDSFESLQAIAAAEVVAGLLGQLAEGDTNTEPIDAWVEAHPQDVPEALLVKSHQVLDRILVQPSELLELWEESDLFDRWKDSITELKNRI